ncbi:uncharacterized protein LOC141852531 [Brevipalpus obovatus]|uniref:uncharacterized protein LOC141852531 n=1 Tax=Brevipalpus obovatus TaxID=246614 RepID=UPI003D9E9C23
MYLINFKLIFVILFILITCSTNLTNSSTSDHGHLKLKNDGPIDIDGVKPSDITSEDSFEGSGSDDGDDEDGEDGEDEDEDEEFDNSPGSTSEGSADLPVINNNNSNNNKGERKPDKPKPTKPELDDEFSGRDPDKDSNPDEDDEDDDNSYDNDDDEGEVFDNPEGSGSKQVDIVALTIANRQNESVIVQSEQEEQLGTFKLSRLVKTMLSIYVVLIFTLTLVSVLIVVIRGQMN